MVRPHGSHFQALHFFLSTQISIWCLVTSAWRTSFDIFTVPVSLRVVGFLSFYFPENVFIYLCFGRVFSEAAGVEVDFFP